VKRLGALYLRDGVCALPDTPASRAGFEGLAERVQELGGQATMVWSAQLSPASAATLFAELGAARRAEYAEATEAANELLRQLRRESAHHALDRTARISLGGDLARLERWLEQIVARDYLRVGEPDAVETILAACRRELEPPVVAAARRAM
jgi:hypothetical protein